METTIAIRGDSITMGAWDIEKGGRATRLHLFLQSRYLQGQGEYGVAYNLGIDGNTSTDVVKRFDTEAEAREPNIIIFAIGANDCIYQDNRTYQTDTETFRTNIKSLIEKAKKYTNQILIMGMIPCDETKMTPIPRDTKRSQDQEGTLLYNTILKEIAQKNKVTFIDMFQVIDTQDLEEGSHPTVQGHEKIFIRIKDFLLENHLI